MDIIFSLVKLVLFIAMSGGGLLFFVGIILSVIGLFRKGNIINKGPGLILKGFLSFIAALILHTVFTALFKAY